MFKTYHIVHVIVASEMTASRTITLLIDDWARLAEIQQFRDMKTIKDALRYAIRSNHSMIIAKKELSLIPNQID